MSVFTWAIVEYIYTAMDKLCIQLVILRKLKKKHSQTNSGFCTIQSMVQIRGEIL